MKWIASAARKQEVFSFVPQRNRFSDQSVCEAVKQEGEQVCYKQLECMIGDYYAYNWLDVHLLPAANGSKTRHAKSSAEKARPQDFVILLFSFQAACTEERVAHEPDLVARSSVLVRLKPRVQADEKSKTIEAAFCLRAKGRTNGRAERSV